MTLNEKFTTVAKRILIIEKNRNYGHQECKRSTYWLQVSVISCGFVKRFLLGRSYKCKWYHQVIQSCGFVHRKGGESILVQKNP